MWYIDAFNNENEPGCGHCEKWFQTFAFVHFAELGLKIQGIRLLQHESSEKATAKVLEVFIEEEKISIETT